MINDAFDFIVLIVIPCIGLFWVIGGFGLFVKPNSKSHELTSSGATVMIDKLCEDPLIGICYNSERELYYVWYDKQYIGSDFASVKQAIEYCRDNFGLFLREDLTVDTPIPMPDPELA